MTNFTILGCGSSLGSPWITNNWGKLNKKNKFNVFGVKSKVYTDTEIVPGGIFWRKI